MGEKSVYLSFILVLLLALLPSAYTTTDVYNITIVPENEASKQIEVMQCQVLSHDRANYSLCKDNIATVFTDIINLTINNSALVECNYQLKCVSEQNEPCEGNKQGILCGACQTNYSKVFGTSSCRECSNIFLLLILPFAVAGLALVFVILKCNLTVSTGHINAIIFYANVVHVFRGIQFSYIGQELTFFSIFISWLNLDIGIETCFYDGMDAYTKVWLQFVFPLYLWVLVALFYMITKLCSPVGRFIGGNSAAVLSVTIFILTYSKILRTITAAVSFTYVNKTLDGSATPVWHEDGNVAYLGQKHTILFSVGIIVGLLYIIPLTLLALFAPCLQAKAHRKPLHWVNKVKPLLDAYQGPYNEKFRCWTGLILVVRILLFILFAVNHLDDPPMYYFLIVTIVGPIGVFVSVKRNHTVYRRKFPNILESFSLLNLTILSIVSWLFTTTEYTKADHVKQYATYISVGVAMLLLIAVVLYQISLQFCPQIFYKAKRQERNLEEDDSLTQAIIASTSTGMELSQPTATLREPLLVNSITDTAVTTE